MTDFTEAFKNFDESGVRWEDDRPEPGTCKGCGAEVPPAEHPCRDLWIPPQEYCYDCEKSREKEQRDRTSRRELLLPRFENCGAGRRVRSHAKRDDVPLPSPLDQLAQKNPDAMGASTGVYLWGPTGGGKSTVSVKTIGRFHKHWIFGSDKMREQPVLKSARYVNLPKAFQDAKDAMDDESINFSWRRMKAADLLVLDELGRERQDSSWVVNTVYDLVNSRYEQGGLTVFTSNFGPQELQNRAGNVYDDRTVRRIMEICGAKGDHLACYHMDQNHNIRHDTGGWFDNGGQR